MPSIHRRHVLKSLPWLAAAASAPLGLRAALAQPAAAYPDKPIRLISPSPPGGGTDSVSRLIASKLTETQHWPFVVENRPGAGNNIGLELGAKSPPDGYTVVMGETSNLAVNQFLFKKLSFDPAGDLAPVALIGTGTLVLVVRSESAIKTYADVLAAARAKPLSYASSGNGTVGHLTAASFAASNGIQLLHVPYKGAGPAMTDLLGGQVDVYFASLTSALPMIQSGKLRAIAVTSGSRHTSLPAVPTLIEHGLKGGEYYVFYGLVAPAKTPAAVIATLNQAVNKLLRAKDIQDALAERGVDSRPLTPAEFGGFLNAERTKWGAIVKASGATAD